MRKPVLAINVACTVLVLATLGCTRSPPNAPPSATVRLSEAQAVSLARAALIKRGYQLEEYRAPELSHDPEGFWRITYRYKVEKPGAWVGALVWEKTQAVEIVPGL